MDNQKTQVPHCRESTPAEVRRMFAMLHRNGKALDRAADGSVLPDDLIWDQTAGRPVPKGGAADHRSDPAALKAASAMMADLLRADPSTASSSSAPEAAAAEWKPIEWIEEAPKPDPKADRILYAGDAI